MWPYISWEWRYSKFHFLQHSFRAVGSEISCPQKLNSRSKVCQRSLKVSSISVWFWVCDLPFLELPGRIFSLKSKFQVQRFKLQSLIAEFLMKIRSKMFTSVIISFSALILSLHGKPAAILLRKFLSHWRTLKSTSLRFLENSLRFLFQKLTQFISPDSSCREIKRLR